MASISSTNSVGNTSLRGYGGMASAVIQPGSPDWSYLLSVFLCPSQTRSLSRLLFPGAFSPARHAKMHTQCRVSIWAGYEIFKVRVKGKSLNCDSWKFSEMLPFH